MAQVKLSFSQIFSIMLLFLLGSTIVVGLNFNLQQDTWIGLLITSFLGVGVLYFYFIMLSIGNWGNLYELLEDGFGKIVGKSLQIVYTLYFCYIGGRVLKDFAFFTSKMLFEDISPWIISFSFISTIGYILYLGIESFARGTQILLFVVITQILMLLLTGYFSNAFLVKNLGPLFQHSGSAIVNTVFPTGITFPYGELIALTILFPLADYKSKLKTYGWLVILVVGGLLIAAAEMIVGILHPKLAEIYVFPFIKALEGLDFLGFLEHFELFAVLINLIGGCIKIFVFAYAALVGISKIRIKNKKNQLIILVCCLIYACSLILSGNLIEHLYIGLKVVPIYLHVPLQFIIPFILTVLLLIKKSRNKAHHVSDIQ
ncbi:spore germination protein [Ectobacillus sp. JY-23]|uniref:GerAB/ArcD/ProY family transporter n=1 Tax=Ectobacillus sp. JY-23 TaxID=2933872 RepID=UPI001FF4EFB3|nr:endospore germination permease [Ectobacillus sp. JY-23]UOY94227.1 spore germination protein [Ectobacillus sp. JY-23]